MIWFFFILRVLLNLALIGAGATLVRNAHARSGIALAAGGAISLLFSCCNRMAYSFLAEHVGYQPLSLATGLLSMLSSIATVAAIIVALIGLAKELERRKKSGAVPMNQPPAQF